MKLNQILLTFFIFIFKNLHSSEKVLILTHPANRPDFIELQDKLYKKFLKDDYEIIVYGNAKTDEMHQELESTCKKLKIKYIRIPREFINRIDGFNIPSEEHGKAIQYSLEDSGFKHNGIVVIMDSDMFLCKEFSIANYLKDHAFSATYDFRHRFNYFLPFLVFFNMNKLPEKEIIKFNPVIIDGIQTDNGGSLYFYFAKYPNTKIRYMKALFVNRNFDLDYSCASCPDCKNKQIFACSHNTEKLKKAGIDDEKQINLIQSGIDNIDVLLNGTFIHYRSASNWDNRGDIYHKGKTYLFYKYIDSLFN